LNVSRFTRRQPRLAALADRYRLQAQQAQQLALILDELAADRHAPSAVRHREDAIDIHVADSLAALEVDQVRAARRIADLGSGAGFPGLPVAVALPRSHVWLVESQVRKCRFLERVCRAAGVRNTEVVCSRVEASLELLSICDVVLARALAPQPIVLEYAAPLLRVGGLLVDWRGRLAPTTAGASRHAADVLGLSALEVRQVKPFADATHHYLHLYLKVRATPEQFPRRPGVARKRPIEISAAPSGAKSGSSDRAHR
jgi:16S rRNA (guanine527-N7)-methyltransferase